MEFALLIRIVGRVCAIIRLMSLRAYLFLIGLGTSLACFAWGVILFTMSPNESGLIGLILFYITLGMMVAGILTLAFSVIRIYFLHRKVIEREIRISFRHAVLCAVIAIVSLILTASGHFSVWYTVGLLLISIVIEYLFLSTHSRRRG
jgi:hypothetical protein